MSQNSNARVERNLTAVVSFKLQVDSRSATVCVCVSVSVLLTLAATLPTFVYVPESRRCLRNSRIVFSSSSDVGVRMSLTTFL